MKCGDSFGPDTEKGGDLNERRKRFSCDVDGVEERELIKIYRNSKKRQTPPLPLANIEKA